MNILSEEQQAVSCLKTPKSELLGSWCAPTTASPSSSSPSTHHQHQTQLLVVAGPSGVGKGTLIQALRKEFPNNFAFSVSHTSREPRPGEQHGVDYYFTNHDVLLSAAERGDFLEWANVFGCLYGTSLAEVDRIRKSGKICLLEIDVQGVSQVQKSPLAKFAKFIFINAPSCDALEKRLRQRATEDEAKLKRRVGEAQREVEQSKLLHFDLCIVNDDVEHAAGQLLAFVRDEYAAVVNFSGE